MFGNCAFSQSTVVWHVCVTISVVHNVELKQTSRKFQFMVFIIIIALYTCDT